MPVKVNLIIVIPVKGYGRAGKIEREVINVSSIRSLSPGLLIRTLFSVLLLLQHVKRKDSIIVN